VGGLGAVAWTLAVAATLAAGTVPAAARRPAVRRPQVPSSLHLPVPPWPVLPEGGSAPPRLGSAAAVLMDWRSGRLLYEHLGFVRRPPASTTKILTALVAVRRGGLDRWVTVSRRAARTGGSRMHLTTGERLRLGDLLTGMLMRSGNDAAVAIAEHEAGSVAAFAVLMNRTARRLGARASHFENPHGLPDPYHYTTAADLALIARAALREPAIARRVRLRQASVVDADGRRFDMTNTNRLLGILPGADGVKTGTTSAAGRCLVASATRRGWRLLAVVLRSPDRWGESAALLEWGFRSFRPLVVARPGEALRRVRSPGLFGREVWVGVPGGVRVVVPNEVAARVHLVLRLDRHAARHRPGERIGTALAVADGRVLARGPAVVVAAGRARRTA
jgi:D-alanyl-D-alanine carboxypeptidase (penicillin-binding protein 5/6)